MKRCILFFTAIVLALTVCACTDTGEKDTGGDTDVGGLFRDILHGIRGDAPGSTEYESN